MADPLAHVNTTSQTNTSASTTITVSVPTHNEDDLLIVYLCHAEAEDGDWTDVTSQGWTLQVTEHQVGQTPPSIPGVTIATKIATDGEPANYTFTNDFSSGLLAVMSSYEFNDTTTPMDASATTAQSSSTGDPNSPSITTVTNGAIVISVGIADATGTLTSAPTNYTNRAHLNNGTGGNGHTLSVSDRVIASSGAEDPGAYNFSQTDEWGAVTLAIRPLAESIGSIDPATFDMDSADVDINGVGFEASQGSGTVYLSDADTLAGSANEVEIDGAINTWSDTLVNLNLTSLSAAKLTALHTLGPGTRYVILVTDGADEYGSPSITLHRPEAFNMSLSSEFAPGGTTAQLTAPATKTTGDMDGGRIEEAANPSATTTDVTADDYREDEWCFTGKTNAREVAYSFRVLYGGEVPSTITVTPSLTITGAVERTSTITASGTVSATATKTTVHARTATISASGTVASLHHGGLRIRVVPFQLRTDDGTQDITTTGMAGSAVKAALFFCTEAASLDSITAHSRLSIGMWDSAGNTGMVFFGVEDGQSTGDSERANSDAGDVIRITDEESGAERCAATIDSVITNGLRLSVDQTAGVGHRGFAVLFGDGGTDLSASVVTVAMNIAANVDVTTIGFEADCAFGISAQYNTNNARSTDGRLSYGQVWNDGTDPPPQSLSIREADNAQTAPAGLATSWVTGGTRFLGRSTNNASDFKIQATTFDSQGFTLEPDGSQGTNQQYILALAFNDVINVFHDDYTMPTTAASDFEITNVGFRPACVVGIHTSVEASGVLGDIDEIASSHYAFDIAGNEGLVGHTEVDDSTNSDTNCYASSSNILWVPEDDGVGNKYLGSSPAMLDNGFEWTAANITTASATTHLGFFMAFGRGALEALRSVTVTGVGTVAATKSMEASRSATATATGTVAATQTNYSVFSRTATITATGAAAATAEREIPRSVTVTAVGTVSATAVLQGTSQRTATVEATGTVAATKSMEAARTAATTATGAVSTSRTVERPRSAASVGAGTVTASGTREVERAATVSAIGTMGVVVEAAGTSSRTAAVAAVGSVAATKSMEASRGAASAAVGTVSATGIAEYPRAAASIGAGTVAAAGVREQFRSATITAVGAVSATAEAAGQVSRTASVTATAEIAVIRNAERVRSASSIGTGTVAASRYRESLRSATSEGVALVVSAVLAERLRSATVTATATVFSDRFTYSVGAGATSSINVGRQMIAKSDETAFPLEVSVDESGGVTGLLVVLALRDSDTPASYLDFNDNTFKTSGWSNKTATLTEYGSGFYGTTLDISTIAGLTGNNMSAEYTISGTVVGVNNAIVTIDSSSSTVENQLLGIEGSLDHDEIMRVLLAAAAGKLSGADGTNVKIRDQADSKDRIDATVDSSGNRTAVTLDTA